MITELFDSNILRVRKSLLIITFIGFAYEYIDIDINEIKVVGEKFHINKPEFIPYVIGYLIIYYLVSFVIRSYHDYIARSLSYDQKVLSEWVDNKRRPEDAIREYHETINKLMTLIDTQEYEKEISGPPTWSDINYLLYNDNLSRDYLNCGNRKLDDVLSEIKALLRKIISLDGLDEFHKYIRDVPKKKLKFAGFVKNLIDYVLPIVFSIIIIGQIFIRSNNSPLAPPPSSSDSLLMPTDSSQIAPDSIRISLDTIPVSPKDSC